MSRAPKQDRAAREAAALRRNLLKRKDQARQREEAARADQEKCPTDGEKSPSSGPEQEAARSG